MTPQTLISNCEKEIEKAEKIAEDILDVNYIYNCVELGHLRAKLLAYKEMRKACVEDEIKFLNLGKIKIEGKTKDMETFNRIKMIKRSNLGRLGG